MLEVDGTVVHLLNGIVSPCIDFRCSQLRDGGAHDVPTKQLFLERKIKRDSEPALVLEEHLYGLGGMLPFEGDRDVLGYSDRLDRELTCQLTKAIVKYG